MTTLWPIPVLTRIVLVWASNAVALLVANWLIDGIRFDDQWRVVIAGAVFGFVNWLVKPIVTLLALPVIVLTLGIALFFVNLLMLYITSWVMPGFEIDSFGSAVARHHRHLARQPRPVRRVRSQPPRRRPPQGQGLTPRSG